MKRGSGQSEQRSCVGQGALKGSTQVCLAALALFACVMPAVALAEESASSPVLPASPIQDAINSSSTEETQLTDPQAAVELPLQDLGREEAVELTEAVFDPFLQG